ncbi:MAG: threonylcarbamoyl-AMP synthase [Deltaproteobacteria bacterium]|nr:threonylcarbamoyl-AMP synthase [Deltaproteobacteria bacterium]
MQTEKAAEILKSGGLVAYPTESFYGLAVDADNETAILRLFRVKKREADVPVLLLIPSVEYLRRYAANVPGTAKRLMDAFWPGGLTLVFEARKNVSRLLTAGTGKIGIRLSSHPVATALAQATGSAITGTSANISGKPPCNTSHGVALALGKGVDRILDGGKTEGQKPSTVLDMTTRPHTVLREGMIETEMLLPYCELVR